MDTQLEISVVAGDASVDEIGIITDDLARWLAEAAPECEVKPATAEAAEGTKGILEILGGLGVRLLEPGALKALVECLAIFIKQRRPDVAVAVKLPSGGSFELKSGALGPKDLQELIARLGALVSANN